MTFSSGLESTDGHAPHSFILPGNREVNLCPFVVDERVKGADGHTAKGFVWIEDGRGGVSSVENTGFVKRKGVSPRAHNRQFGLRCRCHQPLQFGTSTMWKLVSFYAFCFLWFSNKLTQPLNHSFQFGWVT